MGMDLDSCQFGMFGGPRCNRPIHPAPTEVDPRPRCLMHSHDRDKNKASFRQELEAILAFKSQNQSTENVLDFTGFVFPEGDFLDTVFGLRTIFSQATFGVKTNFAGSRS